MHLSSFIFIIYNKMNTLSEDQYIRAQKMRKQELYRNMLDQQVRFNEVKRQKQIQSLRHPFSDGRSLGQHRNSVQFSPDENKYLPPLGHQQPSRQNEWNSKKYSNDRLHTQDDKTELYLNNCEEIIRNLRELKGKKKQWENYGSQPQYNPKRQVEKQKYRSNEIQYYPKPSYFSSSGSAYNKNVGIQPSPKHFKMQSTRLNTLEDPRLSNQKYSKKQSTLKNPKNKKALDKLLHPTADSDLRSPSVQKDSEKQETPESQSPWGIKQEHRIPKKSSKVRHKLFKMTAPKRQTETPYESEHNGTQQIEVNEVKQQDHKNQAELAACLKQLTKYLKNLNEKKENDKDKDKEEEKQQIDENKLDDKIQEQEQQEEKVNQTEQKVTKSPHQQQLSALKSKVIQALKNASKKSHLLLLKMSDRSSSRSPQLSKQKVISPDKEANKYPYQNEPLKQKSENQQLAKLIVTHLEKHEDNGEQLNRCLKELHEYLKNQNQEIRQLKSYRDTQIMNESHQNSKSKLSRHTSPPKNDPKQYKNIKNTPATQRENQIRLQQAILKNLKKARLRGNVFKEKVQSYKKTHNVIQSNQKPSKKAAQNGQPKEPEEISPIANADPTTKVDEKTLQKPLEKPIEKPLQKPFEKPVQKPLEIPLEANPQPPKKSQ